MPVRPLLLAVCVGLVLAGASASIAQPAPAAPPRLIVAIAVDQFSADLFAEYRGRFTGGLARLQQGAVFPSGYQAHAATETCPGHSTILTGVHPARNGIIANTWFDQGVARARKAIYCAEDETQAAADPGGTVASAGHLLVPTLGDRLKAANPASRNVAVAGKDRAALMMGGHAIDQVYWWQGKGFATLPGRTPGTAAQAVNAEVAAELARSSAALAVPADCAAKDRPITVGKVTVGAGRFERSAGDAAGFRISPGLDAATARLAERLVAELDLGNGPATDLLAVSFSATDYVGHTTGSGGLEMCLQMHALDRTIGELLGFLDARKLDYAVVLTADHGGFDVPERLDLQAHPQAARVDPALMPDPLGKAIAARLGIKGVEPLLYGDGPFGDFWLNRALGSAQKQRVLAELKALTAHPQVAAVFTAAELAKSPLPAGSPETWTLLERARASFNPRRSGDVVVLLKRAIVPIPSVAAGYVATHGSPWDYDRRVPILFWRRGLAPFEQPNPVATVDIAPTLAALVGLTVPEAEFDGRCLDLDPGAGNTCGSDARDLAGPRDVLILGGGLVGMALAIGLARAGISCHVVDRAAPETQTAEGFDGRATAISTASWNFFGHIGLAPLLQPKGCPIVAIAVNDGLRPGRIDFRPGPDEGSLGRMFANRELRLALFEIAAREPLVAWHPRSEVLARERGEHGVAVRLDGGRTLRARLMVGAEGRQSPTRDEAGLRIARWSYRHRAIVAGLAHDEPHDNVAWEIFYPSGPFALLPLLDDEHGRHRSALVWTVAEEDAEGMLRMSEAAFVAEAEQRMGGVLGKIGLAAPRAAFPLGFHHTARIVAQRVALVGDAAHGIHPIAGQGLNLGLRDAAALIEVIGDGLRLGLDPGDAQVLARYERWRASDGLMVAMATDGLTRLFGVPGRTASLIRRAGMAAVQRLPLLKRWFMDEARGVSGTLPRLLQEA